MREIVRGNARHYSSSFQLIDSPPARAQHSRPSTHACNTQNGIKTGREVINVGKFWGEKIPSQQREGNNAHAREMWDRGEAYDLLSLFRADSSVLGSRGLWCSPLHKCLINAMNPLTTLSLSPGALTSFIPPVCFPPDVPAAASASCSSTFMSCCSSSSKSKMTCETNGIT